MLTDPKYWCICFGGAFVFWLLPQKIRYSFLFLLSFGYLATLTLWGVIALFIWSLLFYYLAPKRAASRQWTAIRFIIPAILLYLVLFKYISPSLSDHTNFLPGAVSTVVMTIPIGISYYTFRLIHYAIEMRRSAFAEHTLQQFLCYIFLFPIFTAGPIERFDHFLCHQEEKWDPHATVAGLTRIIYGLIKKFVIVDTLLDFQVLFHNGIAMNNAMNLTEIHAYELWYLLAATYIRLYLDFSAYSDIAIGTARLFGFTIAENFNWPILASSIVEFWRRWHMTLAGWVQSYVYMPLIGLWRRPVISLFLSFLIIGLWHEFSISRIAWGFYHATAIVVFVLWSRSGRKSGKKKKASTPAKLVSILLTQVFIVSSMVFFVGAPDKSVYQCLRIFAKLLGLDLPE